MAVAGLMTTGVSTFRDPVACSFMIIVCVVFQGSTKVLIYAYLVEKVRKRTHISSGLPLTEKLLRSILSGQTGIAPRDYKPGYTKFAYFSN
ncbi:hypothetical protein PQX77_010476 [Marasmius sp. AFHP31]|nr:hypothetical protein PQX77_010476 [Marasmius sp. AFHP31]